VDSDKILAAAARLRAANIPFSLVTVVRCESPTSAKTGAKAIVEADGLIQGWIGGGCAQPAVIETAKQAIIDGEPRLIRISPESESVIEEGITGFASSCLSGGTLDIFIDPIIERPKILIMGVAPVAQTLCALASRVGFTVSVFSPSVDRKQFPDATQIIEDVELAKSSVCSSTFIVVATQGQSDKSSLEMALGSEADYITFIGSQRKSAKLLQSLKDKGGDKKRIEAVIAPAGVALGAVTPEEIALSVLAAVVKTYRKRRAALVSEKSLPANSVDKHSVSSCCSEKTAATEISTIKEQLDPVCGMRVDTARSESRFEFEGQSYYFCCQGCQNKFATNPGKYLASTL